MCSEKVSTLPGSPVLKPATERAHFAALDAIRGLAAVSVVFFHVSWTNPTESLHYVRNSYLMVDVFFVLSGFVIFYAYYGKLGSIDGVRHFVWLRFWRLYPLHFTFLIVFLFIEVIKFILERRYGMTANHLAFLENNTSAFFDNLFLTQGLHTLNYLSFNIPAWSISTEFCAYLVFAAVVFVFPTRVATLAISSFLCAICFAILIALGPIGVPLSENFGIIRCLLGFFFGALVYAFYDFVRATPLPGKHPKLSGRIAVLSILAFVAFLASKKPGYSDLCVYPLSALVILLIAFSPKISATRFLYSRPLQWLGAISYSVYMAHFAVLWFVKAFLRFGAHAPDVLPPSHRVHIVQTSPLVGTLGVIASVAIVLAVSQLTFTWIEMPFRNWSRRGGRLRRDSVSPSISGASAG